MSEKLLTGKSSVKAYWHVMIAIQNFGQKKHLTRSAISKFVPEATSTVSLVVDKLLQLEVLYEARDFSLKGTSKHFLDINIENIFYFCSIYSNLSDDKAKDYSRQFYCWLNENIKNKEFMWEEFDVNSVYFTLLDDPLFNILLKKNENLIYFIFICCLLLCYKNKEGREILFLIPSQIRFVIFTTLLRTFSELPSQLIPEFLSPKLLDIISKYFFLHKIQSRISDLIKEPSKIQEKINKTDFKFNSDPNNNLQLSSDEGKRSLNIELNFQNESKGKMSKENLISITIPIVDNSVQTDIKELLSFLEKKIYF